ncbi:HAD hydrolase-like protein [Pectinatus frisingensis]|uniref:HAD hydrolase-like protein n=1 Tax=Pectinatus frisingensis TaxID=865 RepID=UPI003D804CDB
MKKYNAAIFDVDGTVLNTAEGIISSVIYAIKFMGYDIPPHKILNACIGPPIQDSLKKIFDIDGDKLLEMTDVFREHYKNVDLLKAKKYYGIDALLTELCANDCCVGFATYKRQDYAEKLINYFGFSKYTDVICGSDFEGKLKKHDIIENAINRLKIDKRDRVIMIGDTIYDSMGAEKSNIDFIGVTYGYGYQKGITISREKKLIALADSPMEIIELLYGRNLNEN